MKIKPSGLKLIVKVQPKREYKLESNIVIPESGNGELSEGIVVEASEKLSDIYPIGSTVIFPSESGIGQLYGEPTTPHLWLDVEAGQVWGQVHE